MRASTVVAVFAILVSLAQACPSMAAPGALWGVFPAMEQARYGFAVGELADGRLVVAGGVAWPVGGNPFTRGTAEIYSPTTRAWTAIPDLPRPREHMGGAVGTDGRFYVIGGDSLSDPALYHGSTDLQIYRPASNTWISRAPMPTKRTYVTAVGLLDGRILAIGGLQASPYGESTAVEAFTPSTNTWQKRAPLPDGCQSVAAATRPTDGRVYVVGGACTSTWLSNELLVYDPALDTWTTGTPLPDRRAWASAAWGQDGRLYVVAGYNELGTVSTGYVYDPKIGSWSGIPSFPVALYDQGMVATRNGLVVLGGCSRGGGTSECPTNQGYQLDIPPVASILLADFRDVRRANGIDIGLDLGGTGHAALNFTGSTGSAGDTWITVYDPAPPPPSVTFGSVGLSADVLIHTFNNKKGAGLLALYNEAPSKKGLALTLHDAGGTDTLVLSTVDQTGKLVTLKTVRLGAAITENAWYRVTMDVTVDGGLVSVAGTVFKHAVPIDPNSPLTAQVGLPLSFSATLGAGALAGVDATGEVGILAAGVSATINSSVTNILIEP